MSPRAKVVPCSSDTPTFSDECRRYLGVNATYGFRGDDLQTIAEDLGLTPVAFLIRRNHWTLVVSPGGETTPRVYDPLKTLRVYDPLKTLRVYDPLKTLRVYDPTAGLTEVPCVGGQLWYIRGTRGNSDTRIGYTKRLNDDRYSLPEEPLQNLGTLQKNSWDCGPLCIYAAMVAKGGFHKARVIKS